MAKILLGEILRELAEQREYGIEGLTEGEYTLGYQEAMDDAIKIVKRRYNKKPYSE
jgi:hypothetical protein